MRRIMQSLVLAALLAVVPSVRAADDFFFKDGDRVVMIGDSITEQHLYSNYVEMWVTMRFAAWNITFRNVGIGGDTSGGGNSRFKRDVLIHKPTAMTVDFGMNDGGYTGFGEPRFGNYVKGLQGMADQAKAANIRVAWVTPQPLDTAEQGSTALTGYNLTLEKYSTDGVKAIAEKNHGVYVDQFHPYLAALDKARAANPKYERITSGDAVHPGGPGQALMAASILKGLHFPAQVSALELDPGANDHYRGTNCKLTNLKQDGDKISFDRLDAALPFFPHEAMSIVKWAPILEELNHYSLRVALIKPGKYDIRLDGKKIATHTGEELAKGVNLAQAVLAAGPIADQVKAVRTAIEAKNRYHHDRIFRGIVLTNVSLPDWLGIHMTQADIEAKRKAAIEERMAKLPELDAAIRQALTMKPHTFEIVPAEK
jgi:lysophospholipase L1-like esterase